MGRYRADTQLGNQDSSASDWFSSGGSLSTGNRSWRVQAYSPRVSPGDEQPPPCPKVPTPQTSHTDPSAYASSGSPSSETTAASNGESTMSGNSTQGWPFLSSTALQVCHVGKLILQQLGRAYYTTEIFKAVSSIGKTAWRKRKGSRPWWRQRGS